MRIVGATKAVAKLTRPLSNVKNIALIVLAFYLLKTNFNLTEILSAFFSLSFVCSAIYAQNSFYDYEADKNNKNKQHYSEAVDYLGKKNAIIIIFLLFLIGIVLGFFINIYFLLSIVLLSLTGFLYSSKLTRFKEKIILDVLFGAGFTFPLRFTAAWFIFSQSAPPLLVLTALASAKIGGYLLYKEADRKFLTDLKIKNSINSFKKQEIILASFAFLFIAFISFVFLCLNYYFKISILGNLPPSFLWLIPFFLPPILIIYFSVLGNIKTPIKVLRIWGLIYLLLAVAVIWVFL